MQPQSLFHRRAHRFFLCALGFLFSVVTVQAQLPPLPPTNAVRRIIGPALPPVVCTNIQLSWKPYTNAFFEVIGATNLAFTNWYHVANAPLWTTNIVLPLRYPQEFFRVQTVYVVGVQ